LFAGASALSDVLDIRIFVVWEPVLPTEWSRPDASITSNVADNRALHYWDYTHRLSGMYGTR
jgi:hypothetical protein